MLQNSPHKGFLCLSFSCNFIGYFKQALKSDQLFCFNVPFSLPGEKVRFRAESSAIREVIALLRASKIARITTDFLRDVINDKKKKTLQAKSGLLIGVTGVNAKHSNCVCIQACDLV